MPAVSPRLPSQAGTVTRLHDQLYRNLTHGRLAVIGPAGAGKTGAMVLLLLEALLQRTELPAEDRRQVPVPVWLTMGSWQPHEKDLRTWVTATIARDHPYLRAATDFGSNAINHLFDSGRLALFLDGLDEMPPGARGHALTRLREGAGGLPIVLTSRPDEYRETLNSEAELTFAAVVMLQPVDPDAAAAYLTAAHHGSATGRWQLVAEQVRDHADGVLARVLNTPLMLTLARSAYTGRDPTRLLGPDLQDEAALRGHLLDQVLVTAYPSEAERRHAAYWLGWIAHHMTTRPGGVTRDLPWWVISTWLQRRTRITVALAILLTSGLLAGVLAGVAVGVGSGLGVGLALGVMDIISGQPPRAFVPRLPKHGEVRRWLVSGLLSGGLFGGFGFWLGGGAGAGCGVGFGFALGLLDYWTSATVGSLTATPRRLHQQDVRYALAVGLTLLVVELVSVLVILYNFALVLWIGGGFVYLLWPGFVLRIDLLFVLVLALLLGVGLISMLVISASGRLRLTEAGLSRRHGGVRFLSFLDTASARQVLRQAGGTYQFRHADLQDRLAAQFSQTTVDVKADVTQNTTIRRCRWPRDRPTRPSDHRPARARRAGNN